MAGNPYAGGGGGQSVSIASDNTVGLATTSATPWVKPNPNPTGWRGTDVKDMPHSSTTSASESTSTGGSSTSAAMPAFGRKAGLAVAMSLLVTVVAAVGV